MRCEIGQWQINGLLIMERKFSFNRMDREAELMKKIITLLADFLDTIASAACTTLIKINLSICTCSIIKFVILTIKKINLYLYMTMSSLKLFCICSKHKTLCIFSLTRCVYVIPANTLGTASQQTMILFYLLFSNIIVKWEVFPSFFPTWNFTLNDNLNIAEHRITLG